jgi:hypothetical protein
MDANLRFSNAQAVTATAVSTFTYDLFTGNLITTSGGTYTVPPVGIIGNASFFGEDFGIGRGKGTPRFVVTTGSGTPAAATSLQIVVQGAPDVGSAGTIAALTFIPYIQTRAIPLASITASSRIASIDWPKREVAQPMPRFIQLNYIVAGSNFTGLTLYADVTLGPDDSADTLGKYPSNY